MGFLDKMKNLFTEEVEEEEIKPQRKEIKPVENIMPKRENVIKRENDVNETDSRLHVTDSKLEENKEKFVFPVYFDDKDFDDLEKPKVKEKTKMESKEPKKEPYQGAKVVIEPEPKKVFKPSPIISPVYGVLDKNYSKDDITTKKSTSNFNRNIKPANMTVDDIRNKAYGTLEDDLESTLSYDFSELEEKPKHEAPAKEALDIFNELDFENIEEPKHEAYNKLQKDILMENPEVDDDTEELARQLEEQKKKLEEISQYMNDNQASVDEESVIDLETDEEEVTTFEDDSDDELNVEDSNLNDSELFDLIDSMYEKKDDDE